VTTETATHGHTKRLFRFGVFELDTASGELRKQGVRIKLQTKPLQILRALLEAPGEVVTREELRRLLWPDETFVDFESGLNTAMNRLRLSLGDSAETPRYIETLARTGYRFIGPVKDLEWPPEIAAPAPAPAKPSIRWRIAAILVSVAVLALFVYLYLRWPRVHEAKFRQLTYRRGNVSSTRFAPNGKDILYTAQWDRDARQLFLTNSVSPESRALGFSGMTLASVSAQGELALLKPGGTMNIGGGALSRVPMNGGAPFEVDRGIMGAEWSADGSKLALVRAIKGASQLEFPPGQVLYRTAGWLANVRISRDNSRIAFVEHPVRHDDAGSVKLIDAAGGGQRTLCGGWSSVGGLAWHPSGKEIWFTAAREGGMRSVWAVNLSGKVRAVAQAPGILTLRDISPDGRVLVTVDTRRLEMAGRIREEKTERSFSWLDWSRVQQLSADGSLVLFDENGEGAGSHSLIYIHRTLEGSTVRVGEGRAMALSPDGQAVLALDPEDRTRFRLLPFGPGPSRELPPTGLEYQWARFFPDGQRLLVLGNERGKGLRLYVLSPGARPAPVTPEMMVRNVAIAPDGRRVAVLSSDGKLMLYPTTAGEPQIIPATEPLAPVHWSHDGQWLFVQHLGAYTELPARVSRVRVATGEIRPWKDLAPWDQMGVSAVTGVAISGDERSYVYSYRRMLSDLFVVEGWQ
jgi:DNA-binding winged helix-turn-helix (wHTH) protein/Tol biopolymer transport system component